MIDYTQPPIAYLVRMPDPESAQQAAEDAVQFLGYEQIGPVVSSSATAAVELAEAIFSSCKSSHASVEVDPDLVRQIPSYLASWGRLGDLEGPPAVLVCDTDALYAALLAANVCIGEEVLVAPGGIVSVHWDPDGKPPLVAIARSRIQNWKFSDMIAMIADEAHAGPQR